MLITHDKIKFKLTEEQKNGVFNAVSRGEKFVILQGSMVPLTIPPTVIESRKWFAQENERLKTYKKRLCRKCGSAIDLSGGCSCWGRNGARGEDPIDGYHLPEEIKLMLHQGVKPKLIN